MSDTSIKLPSKVGDPTWEAAYLLPTQGQWTEEDFLKFHTNRMAELVDGSLEVLPTPTLKHQKLLKRLLKGLESAVEQQGGLTLFAPLPVRLFPGRIREPDLLYISPDNMPAADVEYPARIDLAVEIVSEGTDAHRRDYVEKRADYARAGISEYWIVDPFELHVIVLSLSGESYHELGTFRPGQIATGKLLADWSVDVQRLFSENS